MGTESEHSSQSEDPLPRIWQIPLDIRRRLSSRVGRQRSLFGNGHTVIVLHRVPQHRAAREAVYFWRNDEGEWFFSEQGAGISALQRFVESYQAAISGLDEQFDEAENSIDWFTILDTLGPLVRAARNMHDVLGQTLDHAEDWPDRQTLQAVHDQTNEIVRASELLQADLQSAIQYQIIRQSEIQAGFSRYQSVAAHRLNVLAAIFLPVATISSVFGMNLQSGLETQQTPWLFWGMLTLAISMGGLVGIFVMRIRGLNPDEW